MADMHRLSSIELLPEAATADINWAIDALAEGRRTDSDILFEFNDRLRALGLDPVSKSAFGRYALKKRKVFGGWKEATAIATAFAKEDSPVAADDLTVLLAQMLKTAIFNLVVEGRSNPKEVMEMSRALGSLVAAQRMSATEKTRHQASRAEAGKVLDAAETAMAEAGRPDGADLIRRIREEVYGIFDRPAEGAA